jgi:hypothetical protein
MKNSNIKSKRQARNTKRPQGKLRDLLVKKDPRAGEEMSLNYGKIKYEYKP